jgi:hypothetical protein
MKFFNLAFANVHIFLCRLLHGVAKLFVHGSKASAMEMVAEFVTAFSPLQTCLIWI